MIVYHAYRIDSPAFYVGKTTKSLEHRRKRHERDAMLCRTKSRFHKAIRKYGVDGFEWRVLDECSTVDELNRTERAWIALVRDCGHKLYNLTDGGDGGDCGGSTFWKNNSPSPEMREKISISLKQYYTKNPHPRKGLSCEGRKHSEDAKKRISESKMGHSVSVSTRDKLRAANIGKKLKPHVLELLMVKFSGAANPSARRVVCITTGETFDFAKLAADKYSIDLSSIIKCCRGKAKSVGGKVFEYAPAIDPTAYPAGWGIQP